MSTDNNIKPDVESPPSTKDTEEDPSVVVTADDDSSSVGTEEASTSEGKERRFLKVYLPLMLLAGVVVITVVAVVVSCPFKKHPDSVANNNNLDEHDPTNCKNKTKAPKEDEPLEEEEQSTLPTTLPFPDVSPIQSFSADILNGYSTQKELEQDLTSAVKHMLNRVLLQNVYDDYYYSQEVWQDEERERPRPNNNQQQVVAQQAGQTATTAQASKTNNQEADADEADHIKNDEQYVYAAYGDFLVVWDHSGQQIAQVQMPGGGIQEALSGWAPPTYINGLLLTPTRVVILVDAVGRGEFLNKHQGTQVRIYSKPTATTPEMTLLKTHELNGSYRDGRWLPENQSLHLVTSGDIHAYPHLLVPLQRHQFPVEYTPEEYVKAATELATETLIPEFVQGLARALLVENRLPNLLQVNAWGMETNTPSVEETMKGHELFYSADGPMRSFVQVTSFNPEKDTRVETSPSLVSSVVLAPSADVQFYATANSLVLALVHSQYNETSLHMEEELFLIHLEANNGSFQSVASLPGHVNSPYSLDVQGNDLRVATTLQKYIPMDRVGRICGEFGTFEQDECMTEDSFNQCFEFAFHGCQDVIRIGCPYEYSCADATPFALQERSSTENHVIVLDVSTPGEMKEIGRARIGDPHEVITSVRFGETFSYATTFDQSDPFYVLQLEPGQAPKVSGSLKLEGFSSYLHPLNPEATLLVGIGQNTTESISETGTGVMQVNMGVLLTVFDVSDPANPVAVASHMVEKEDSVDSHTAAEWDAKAVQYANGKLVLPITMYRHEWWDELGDDETWFHGEPNMDDFVDQEEEETAVTAKTTQEEDFQGFIIFTVGYTGIQEAFRINQISTTTDEPTCHYCNGNLGGSRSILLDDGSLMTTNGDSVQSNSIYTGQTLWQMNVTLEGVPKDCCW